MKIFFTFFLVIFVSFNLFAQTDTIPKSDRWDDYKIKPADTSDFSLMNLKKFKNFKSNIQDKFYDRPVIEFSYGQSKPTFFANEKTDLEINEINMIEAKIGYMETKYLVNETKLLKMDFNYLSAAYYNINLGSLKSNTNKLLPEGIKIGYTTQDGWGWLLGKSSDLLLTHSGAWTWTKLDFKNMEKALLDSFNLSTFQNRFSFGDEFYAGIRLRVFDHLSLNAEYGRSIIQPRHMFWYWALGNLIEGAAQGVAESFAKNAINNSSDIAPIAYFILKNAISYGFYELRTKNMNWPSETTEPFMFDTYRVGVSLVF